MPTLALSPESTRHSKTALASELKANVGVLSFVVPVGPEVMVVSGAVVSDAGGGGGGAGWPAPQSFRPMSVWPWMRESTFSPP